MNLDRVLFLPLLRRRDALFAREKQSIIFMKGRHKTTVGIECGVEDRIEEYSEDVQLKRSLRRETYDRRGGIERTDGPVNDCGLGNVRVRVRDRFHARAWIYLALCLRLVVAIINDERRDGPRRTIIMV
jgi:hypothetical protein